MLNYDFDWSVLWREPYGRMFVDGIRTTVCLSLASWTIAVLIGLFIAVCRMAPSRTARLLGTAYVEIFRNVPLLVQIFFWYFAVPSLLPRDMELWLYRRVTNLAACAGAVSLAVYTASRVAEVFRSGLLAVPQGQYRAAFSTGLSRAAAYRHVILPYAFRISLPLLTTEFLTCFKNSALTMTIGVMETTGMANYIDSFTFHGLETTTAASFVYLGTSAAVILAMTCIEKKMRIPGMIRRKA